jgi:hypothetical protein
MATVVAASLAPALPAQAAATVQLPAPAAVGQSVVMGLTVDASSAGAAGQGTLAVRLSLSRRVAAVNDATGTFTTQSYVASLEVAEAPAGYDVAPLDSLAGASISQAFASTGAPLTAPRVEDAASDAQVVGSQQLAGWLAITSIAFPQTPVAVGESWTSGGTAPIGGGMSVPVVYQCRLAAVEAGQYTVEISYAATFSVSGTALGQLDGGISGQATLVGMLDNPLVLSGRVDQVMDAIASTGDTTAPLSTTSAIGLHGTA